MRAATAKPAEARGTYHPQMGETRGNNRFMPKTTNKRTAARRAARVQRAHTTQQEGSAVRRRPTKKPVPTREHRSFLFQYKWGIGILLAILLASGWYTIYAKQLLWYAPKPPAAQVIPALPASAAKSPCQKVAQYLQTTEPIPDTANITHTYSAAPPMIIDKNKVYCVGINTTKGFMLLELDPQLAPNTVNNFVYLADHHFYDGLTFWRVERKGQTDSDGTVSTLDLIQGGDPQGNGQGGPGYSFNDELNQTEPYIVGAVAMANSGPNTNGSQFFIDTNDDSAKDQLPDHKFSLFGNLVKGIDVAVKINPGDKMLRVLVMAVDGPPSLPPVMVTPTPVPTHTPTPGPTNTSTPAATSTPKP
jgi:peptidylprolyl isomerase